MKDKKPKDILNEPAMAYLSKSRVKIYHSFEEAEEGEIEEILKQKPIDRIRNTVNLILRVYGVTREELANRPRERNITITKNS